MLCQTAIIHTTCVYSELNRTAHFKDLAFVVEDSAILSTALDRLTGSAIRTRMLEARPLSELVGEPVASYIAQHSIAAKVCGRAQWTQADKQFAFDRNTGAAATSSSAAAASVVCEEDRPYDRLPVKTYMRRQSQLPLQY
jgi:hypothetical protein